jgi:hypothetical protein
MQRPSQKIDLTTFLLSVSSAAYLALGARTLGVAEGEGADEGVNLELARQNIDLLELILEKTRGNRTEDEERLISQLLFEVRMKFVETQRKVSAVTARD